MHRFGPVTAAGVLISVCIACVDPARAEAPPVTGSSVSLYSDVKASKMGDVLSVIIVESNSASKNSQTATRKQNKAAVKGAATTGALDGLFPGAGGSLDLSDQYTGQGTTARNGQLNSRMTVKVIDILPNRDLVIEGTKTLEINEDTEVVTLSGIVRTSDISSANTVFSHQVGNARFTYKGTGALSQAQRPGFLTRIINWLL
ncbi:MAG: flagellar basal body L-ring protein FlgH [Candidatus Latescibacterota bacterium]